MPNQFVSRIRGLAGFILILAVIFISYLPALRGEFLLWDDDVHVVDNVTIRGLDFEHLQEMFTSTVNKIYIPLTSLSFAIEYHYFGYKPFLYHLDNVLLHLLVVILLFLLGRKLGLTPVTAGLTALIFGVHPIHVESVAWVTERKDVLYAAFYMSALLCYVHYLEKKAYKFLLGTTILGVLSMLAKPMALSLPLVLFLFDWIKDRPSKKQVFIEKLPLFILIGGIGFISYASHARVPGESIIQSVLIWPWTFVFYLRQFFFPVVSLPLYHLPKPVILGNPEYLVSVMVLVVVIGSLVYFRRHRWFVFAVLFYFFSIFFLLRFDEVKDTNIVADRFMYLPCLGLFLFIGLSLQSIYSRQKKVGRGIMISCLVVLIAVFSVKTFYQSSFWQNSFSLWRHQLKYSPDEPIALNNLATALGKQKENKDAEKEYKRVMNLKLAQVKDGLFPSEVESIRRVDSLIAMYKKAIKADPDFKDALYNLGNLYSSVGRFPDAVEAYKNALRIDPKMKDAHAGLGDLYVEIGDVSRAVYAFEQAIRFNPNDADLHINVVSAYTDAIEKNPKVNAYIEARGNILARYSAIVNSNPKAASYFNLGNLYAKTGDASMALLAYRRALELNPLHAATLFNLGFLEETGGNFKKALNLYQKSVQIDPNNAEGYYNLGNVYAKLNKTEEAIAAYLKAVDKKSDHTDAWINLSILSFQKKDFTNAVKYCDKAVSLGYEAPDGYLSALAEHRQ